MSHRNCLHRKSFWLLLLLLPAFFPLSTHALDLSLSNMAVTGGANYVIKGNIPQDKRYNGALICDKTSLEKLPTTTQRTPLHIPRVLIIRYEQRFGH